MAEREKLVGFRSRQGASKVRKVQVVVTVYIAGVNLWNLRVVVTFNNHCSSMLGNWPLRGWGYIVPLPEFGVYLSTYFPVVSWRPRITK